MPLTADEVNELKQMLYAMIPADGRYVGNKTLRRQLGAKVGSESSIILSDDDYWTVREALLSEAVIRPGRGNGGSVARVTAEVETVLVPTVQRRYKDEGDLYPPLLDVLRTSWVKNYGIEDFVSQITASQGSRNTGGKWTRPDITLVAVRIYPFIPGKSIEVITFEVKPWYYLGVEGVFETASHSAYAHRSYLVIHAPDKVTDNDAYTRIQRETERFGVGLITCEDPTDWDTFNIRVEAEHKVPDPVELCSFVSGQLSKDNQTRIQRMIR